MHCYGLNEKTWFYRLDCNLTEGLRRMNLLRPDLLSSITADIEMFLGIWHRAMLPLYQRNSGVNPVWLTTILVPNNVPLHMQRLKHRWQAIIGPQNAIRSSEIYHLTNMAEIDLGWLIYASVGVATLSSIQVSAMDFESAHTWVWQYACHTHLLETHSGNLIFGHGFNYVKELAVVFLSADICGFDACGGVTVLHCTRLLKIPSQNSIFGHQVSICIDLHRPSMKHESRIIELLILRLVTSLVFALENPWPFLRFRCPSV